jgi:hypothetical protein
LEQQFGLLRPLLPLVEKHTLRKTDERAARYGDIEDDEKLDYAVERAPAFPPSPQRKE